MVKKFGNQMAFSYQNFYHGHQLNSREHLNSNHLNTKQVKLHYSDKLSIGMFAIQIPTVSQISLNKSIFLIFFDKLL